MVTIHSRSSWGARFRDGDLTLTGLAAEVFLHHTVTTLLAADATVEAERAQMRAIERIGQDRFGTGISYNVVIFPSGRVYQGVSWGRRGTHTDDRNSTARSICFAGNYDVANPTRNQLATAAAILREGKDRWWRAGAPLRLHRDIKPTACPGRNIAKFRTAIASGSVLNAIAQEDDDMTPDEVREAVWGATVHTPIVLQAELGETTTMRRLVLRSAVQASIAAAKDPDQIVIELEAEGIAEVVLDKLSERLGRSS